MPNAISSKSIENTQIAIAFSLELLFPAAASPSGAPVLPLLLTTCAVYPAVQWSWDLFCIDRKFQYSFAAGVRLTAFCAKHKSDTVGQGVLGSC